MWSLRLGHSDISYWGSAGIRTGTRPGSLAGARRSLRVRRRGASFLSEPFSFSKLLLTEFCLNFTFASNRHLVLY